MRDSEPHYFHRPIRRDLFTRLGRRDPVNPLVKLCACIVLLVIAGGIAGAASQAEQLFHQAEKAEHDGEIVKAYLLYAEAAAADPTNIDYWSRAQALRPAASLVDASPPKLPDLASDKVDRTLFGNISDAELEEARKPLPPTRLEAEPGRRDYDLRGDSKALWEQVAAALHLKVVFDADYKPTRAFRFELANADYRDALHALQAATDSFLVPISQRLIFVANDSTQKRTRIRADGGGGGAVPGSNQRPGAAGYCDQHPRRAGFAEADGRPARRLIVIRDRVTKVRLAEMLLADLLRPRAQVTIDVEILTTDLSSSLSYGLGLPTSFALSSFLNRANLAAYISLRLLYVSGIRRRRQPAGTGHHQRTAFRDRFQVQLGEHFSCAGGGGGGPSLDAARGRKIPHHYQRLFWKHVGQRHGVHPATHH